VFVKDAITVLIKACFEKKRSQLLNRKRHGGINLTASTTLVVKYVVVVFFFFPEKEAKSVVLLRRRQFHTQNSAKPTLGVWGLAPKKQH
jgi:hypothetical protein